MRHRKSAAPLRLIGGRDPGGAESRRHHAQPRKCSLAGAAARRPRPSARLWEGAAQGGRPAAAGPWELPRHPPCKSGFTNTYSLRCKCEGFFFQLIWFCCFWTRLVWFSAALLPLLCGFRTQSSRPPCGTDINAPCPRVREEGTRRGKAAGPGLRREPPRSGPGAGLVTRPVDGGRKRPATLPPGAALPPRGPNTPWRRRVRTL